MFRSEVFEHFSVLGSLFPVIWAVLLDIWCRRMWDSFKVKPFRTGSRLAGGSRSKL